MPKFSSKNPMPGPGAPKPLTPGGGGDFLSQVKGIIDAAKEGFQLLKELREMSGSPPTNQAQDQAIDVQHRIKPDKGGGNPGLNKFLAKYGDATVNDILKLIGPMTLKQLAGMIQHGNRPE